MDQAMLKAIAVALTEGQGQFDEAELEIAYQEINDAMIKGTAASLVLEGEAALRVVDGTVAYTGLGDAAGGDLSGSHLRLVDSPSPPD